MNKKQIKFIETMEKLSKNWVVAAVVSTLLLGATAYVVSLGWKKGQESKL